MGGFRPTGLPAFAQNPSRRSARAWLRPPCDLHWTAGPLLLPGLLFGARFHILVLGYLYAGEGIEIARRT
jgi:hypothetical protein